MVYSALLCNTLLALAGTADAAPSGEKRFNQPHFDPAHLHMPIRSVSRRVADPDPAVQVAYARDEAINHRIKYAARLDPETYEIHKRDLEFLESEQQSRKRAPGAVS